jgi:hypothetical protein
MSGDEILAAIDKRSKKREWLVSKAHGAWQALTHCCAECIGSRYETLCDEQQQRLQPLVPTQDFPFDEHGVLRWQKYNTVVPRLLQRRT